MYATAKGYANGGCNCIPVNPKTKKPMVAWARWQRETVPSIELAAMLEKAEGIAVICGAVSGALEVIDFDEPDIFPCWKALINNETLKKLVIQRTQSGGFHVAYRCAEGIERNQKLAMRNHKTAIETRGQGGYIIAAPTPGYEVICGDWSKLNGLTREERDELITAARTLNEKEAPGSLRNEVEEAPQISDKIARPGDDYMRRTSWEQILEPVGWKQGDTKNGTTSWTRPGKPPSDGHSATANYYGDDRLHVFSQNAAPFEGGRTYSKLGAHCLLNYSGDFSAMIADLRRAGYGTPTTHDAPCNIVVDQRNAAPYPSIDIGETEPIDEVDFWWRPYIPKGKAVLLDGDSGTRKTTLVLSLAAAFSNGVDPVTNTKTPALRTLYFGKEDTPEELGTVYQANRGKKGFAEVYPDAFSLTPSAIDALARKIEQDGWNIIVFDAYLYFLEGIVRDSNSSIQEIKAVTQALQEVYKATGASGLHIRHTAKHHIGKSPASMGVGSYQFRASHRGQLLVRRHPEKGRDIVVTDCKGNLLVEQGAMFGVERLGNEMRYYTIDGDPFEPAYEEKEKPQANSAALDLIRREIKGGETRYASEIYAIAKEKGVSKSSLHRATQTLGIEAKREGARWTWHMPDPFE